MDSRRVKRSINALERDIINCEEFLSNVFKSKVDKPSSNAHKPVQDGPGSVRGIPVIPTGSVSSQITRSRRDNTQPSNTANRVLCKEVFLNNNATVEVRVTTKESTAGKNRKRPRPNVLITPPEIDRSVEKDEIQKQSDVLFQPPVPSKFNRNVQHEKKGHLHTNHRPLPWALMLKHRNTPCIIHSAKTMDREDANREKLHHNLRRPIHSFKRSHKRMVREDSLSSSLSNETPGEQESPNFVSRSVQCSLPKIIIPDDKHEMSPSKPISKYNSSDVGDFSMFNPVRTLNFLVKELHEKLQKNEKDDSVQRIIKGMEDAVMQISSETNCAEVTQNSDIPTRDETASTKKPYQTGFVSMKSAQTSHAKPVTIPGMRLMEQSSLRQFEQCFPPLHGQYTKMADLRSFKPIEPAKEITLDTQTAQTQLELKCARLKLECDQLREERDSLKEKMSSAKEEIGGLAKKENDYLTAIGFLRTNLENMMKKVEEHASTAAELAALNAQLTEENKGLRPLRDAEAALARHLGEHNEEEGNIQLHLQIMKLQHEKYETLMASKDMEVKKLKQELRDIQAFVLEKLMDLKSLFTTPMAANQGDKGKQSPFDKESKLQSLATEISLLKKADGRDVEKQPVCSSPTSSIPSSLAVYPSWQMISRISSPSHKDVNKLPSKEIFKLSVAAKNNIKDSRDSSNVEGDKSFSFTKLKSAEFKSFLEASLSENTTLESRSELTTIEPKTHEELKDKLRHLFEKLKEQARRETGISLPSPPHLYSEISEPGGMSQWTEVSDVESLPNSHCFSSSSAELNKGKFDISASDLSFEIKFGEADS